MTLQEIINLPIGQDFVYEGKPAKVLWQDQLEYLIVKGNPKANTPEPDIYFRSYSMQFSTPYEANGIVLTSSFPVPKLLELPQYQRTNLNQTTLATEGFKS